MLPAVPGVQAPDGILACQASLLGPRRLVALWAWIDQDRLDRALADGADPRASATLAARSAQLASRRARASTAAALERLALGSDASNQRFAVPPRRAAVAPNRSALLDLAARVRSDGPAYVRGLAAARLLVTDGTGPAYTDRRGEGLAREIELVSAGLRS